MLYYLAAANLVGFFIMAIDKQKARKHRWRISEKCMWMTALLGGGVGVSAGVLVFRHKTQHKLLRYGILSITVMEIAAFAVYFIKKYISW